MLAALTGILTILTASGQIWSGFTLEKVANAQEAAIFSSSTSVQNLVEQGRKYYESGNFQEAERVLLQAASALTNGGDRVIQAMIYSNLSLVYQQMGNWENAEKYINQTLQLLQSGETATNSTNRLKILAQSLDVLARLQMERGEAEKALNSWQQASDIYSKLGDENRKIRSQLNQAEALQALGLYPRCKELLVSLNLTLQKQQNSRLKADAMRSLGDVLRVVGETEDTELLWQQLKTDLKLQSSNSLKQSREILEKSLQIAKEIKSPQDLSAFYLSLGNTARALYQKERDLYERSEKPEYIEAALSKWAIEALNYYQCSTDTSTYCSREIQGKLNQINLLVDISNWLTKLKPDEYSHIDKWWKKLENQIAELPQIEKRLAELQPMKPSEINAYINFTQSLIKLKQISADIHEKQKTYPAINYSVWETIYELNDPIIENMENAAIKAKELNNQRLEAESLGSLGGLYEQLEKWDLAKSKSEDALKIAQSTQAWDIAYWLQWQLGRIYKSRKDIKMAVKFYSAAVKSLESVRKSLLVLNQDAQFSFRDNVEPIYRDFVDLLLQPENPSQDNLQQARDVVQELQLAELENFLRCSLRSDKLVSIEKLVKPSENVVFIYPIILPDRLEVIISIPGQPLRRYKPADTPQIKVEEVVKTLLMSLQKFPFDDEGKMQADLVYQWLIKPAETDSILNPKKNQTLVFVLDGVLRNIPMAALWDAESKKYLLDKYAVAIAPGSQLSESKELRSLKILIAGLSEDPQYPGYGALKYVKTEVDKVKRILKDSSVLLNQKFTSNTLDNEVKLSSYTAIHIATHGQFSSDPNETFILTSPVKKPNRINLNELKDLLGARDKNIPYPIDLLVFSACNTADGDKRAVLGLAGLAVRAGARSTLATLWSVNDESTAKLMELFYTKLLDKTEKLTKAEALRQAQQELLMSLKNQANDIPLYWAPYVLVGDWH